MTNGSERRRWARYAGQGGNGLPLLWVETEQSPHAVMNGKTRDIGMGGCSFELERAPQLPEFLSIKMLLPSGGALDVEGRIAWRRPEAKGLCVGVTFPGLHGLEARLLQDFFQREAANIFPTARQEAIAEFERGVFSYHQRQLTQARRQFQKVIQTYGEFIDVAAIARRYLALCQRTGNSAA